MHMNCRPLAILLTFVPPLPLPLGLHRMITHHICTLPDNQSQNPDEVTPPNDLDHRAYEESGLAAWRHAKQAVE